MRDDDERRDMRRGRVDLARQRGLFSKQSCRLSRDEKSDDGGGSLVLPDGKNGGKLDVGGEL